MIASASVTPAAPAPRVHEIEFEMDNSTPNSDRSPKIGADEFSQHGYFRYLFFQPGLTRILVGMGSRGFCLEKGTYFRAPISGRMEGREITYQDIKGLFTGIPFELYEVPIRYMRFLNGYQYLVVVSLDVQRRVFKVTRNSPSMGERAGAPSSQEYALELHSCTEVSKAWTAVDQLSKLTGLSSRHDQAVRLLGSYQIYRHIKYGAQMSHAAHHYFVLYNTMSKELESWKFWMNRDQTSIVHVKVICLRTIHLTPEEIFAFCEEIEDEDEELKTVLCHKIHTYNCLAEDAAHTIEKENHIYDITPLSWTDLKRVSELIRSGCITMSGNIGSLKSIQMNDDDGSLNLFFEDGEMIATR
jgi:hypothetical protein